MEPPPPPTTTTENSIRWHCKYEGCEKNFARKEHLNRHERTHIPAESLFICTVCQQKFNRSDSLQRHILRHGDEYKPTPSGRSKRACITCHKGKIKCDGNTPCAKCASKAIDCKYEKEKQSPASESSSESTQNPSPESRTSENDNYLDDNVIIQQHDDQMYHQNHDEINMFDPPMPIVVRHTKESPLNPFGKLSVVDWMNVKIRKDEPLSPLIKTPKPDDVDALSPPFCPSDLEQKYLIAYYTHFHHRWPIIHRPSHADENESVILVCAMKMNGAWLYGTPTSRLWALAMQGYLISKLPPMLSSKTSVDRFHGGLSSELCQAALLSIIFTFYVGVERTVSKSILLLSLLVTALREAGFFKAETVMDDDRPGYFLPMHIVRVGVRSRLASYLLKLDCSLSLLRDQPPMLALEDLHFPPQVSFALWDSDGLHIWENRLQLEPSSRNYESVSNMIMELTANEEANTGAVLIEDIQLCMHAMHLKIRQLYQGPPELRAAMESLRETWRGELDGLKIRLDRMVSQGFDMTGLNEEQHPLLRYYRGYEDQTHPNWQNLVIRRVKTLIFDSLHLYHTLSIHLDTDIRTIRNTAKDFNVTTNLVELNDRHKNMQDKRAKYSTNWANSDDSITALTHAREILMLHKSLAEDPEFDNKGLDPIAYGAICASMLTVWAFCMFSANRCQLCYESPEKEHEHSHFMIDQIPVCVCTTTYLVEHYRSFLPERWEIPRTGI